jgi:quercetin dioxygenase-like cupin family protein
MPNEFVYLPINTGQAYWVMGDMFTYLITGEQSGGSYFTVLVDVAPHGGPLPHVHHLEDEQFYILSGELTFSVGDQTFQASIGDFIHIPRETLHFFKNGPRASRILATFSPAGIEGFFNEAGEVVKDRLASPPPVTEETMACLAVVEAAGWKDHHDTALPTEQGR